MGKVRKHSGKADSASESNAFRKKKKFSKPAVENSKKPVRYFNSPLKPESGEKDNTFKLKGKKKNKKGGGISRKNAGPAGAGAAVPPKPKRLKKSPFKVRADTSKESEKGNQKPKKSEKVMRSSKRKSDDGLGGVGKNSSGGNDEAVATRETKERIKKIKNSAHQNNLEKKNTKKTIIKPGGRWYDNSGSTENTLKVSLSKENVKQIYNSASTLFAKDIFAYKQACLQGDQKSDFQWMEKMMRVGTLPDKMAAYVVRIQDSPIHNLQHLHNLISMVKVQSKQQCLMAADTLKDLFLEDLLPPNRKLVSFEKRGNIVLQGKESQLITWYFEDQLKASYINFINALKQMSLDNVEKIRAKAISLIYILLTSHPEQEDVLLQMLVNKLGDTMKKVASRALFYLNSLLITHPRMKLVVIDEVERLLFRNNIAKRAQYYGICFLNSINLNNEHPEVACKLINVYVAFFKGCIKTGDIESKMMSALLTGVNKSYPLAKEYGYKFTENIDTLYKITHLSNFNISIQALSILFQLTDVDTRPNEADRYYRVLYKELLRPEMATTSHSVQFLNLIYKSMKCDNRLSRVMGFSKRLLMICQNVQPNLACAILFLLSEVAKVHSGIIRCGSSEFLEGKTEDTVSSDAEDEQDSSQTDEAIINLMKISNVKVNSSKKDAESDSDEVKNEYSLLKSSQQDVNVNQDNTVEVEANDQSVMIVDDIKSEYKQKITEYDPYARNPCYSGAEFSLFYEVAALAQHYHPSVAVFAASLLRKEPITYEGNPLKDFTISRFLERFVYRNSKKPKTTRGGRTTYQPKGLRNIAVNSADYLKNDEEDIPVEEKFFYRYFKEKKATDDNADAESETESVGDDEFDELMANYFKSPKGKDKEDDDISEELDFASNISTKTQSRRKKKVVDDVEESDDEEPADDGGTDEEDMFGDADEMLDMDDDDELDFQDEEGLEVFEDDFDEPVQSKKMKKLRKDLDMFAPAEQFAEMLEANADENISGPSQLISRDNADPKQLQWEMDRDRWAKGYKRNLKSKFKGKNKGRKIKRTKN